MPRTQPHSSIVPRARELVACHGLTGCEERSCNRLISATRSLRREISDKRDQFLNGFYCECVMLTRFRHLAPKLRQYGGIGVNQFFTRLSLPFHAFLDA